MLYFGTFTPVPRSNGETRLSRFVTAQWPSGFSRGCETVNNAAENYNQRVPPSPMASETPLPIP